LLPFRWYLDFVVAGAEENGLPSDYCDRLRATAFVEDTDLERAQSSVHLLEE
jgi:hypothetical protein